MANESLNSDDISIKNYEASHLNVSNCAKNTILKMQDQVLNWVSHALHHNESFVCGLYGTVQFYMKFKLSELSSKFILHLPK